MRKKQYKIQQNKIKKPSSKKWLHRHLNDQYVQMSKIDGYRSRSAYKLIEIHKKFHIFTKGAHVIDLGAAPGGWTQVAAQFTLANLKTNPIIAIDILEMEPIPNVVFIQHDFLDFDTIKQQIPFLSIDVIMSDMAANTTGHRPTDHLKILALCEQALNFSLKYLKPSGHFICKIFQGGTESFLLEKVKANFQLVKHFKPEASRKESPELYLIALKKK